MYEAIWRGSSVAVVLVRFCVAVVSVMSHRRDHGGVAHVQGDEVAAPNTGVIDPDRARPCPTLNRHRDLDLLAALRWRNHVPRRSEVPERSAARLNQLI